MFDYKKGVFDFRRLTLYTDGPDKAKRARMTFGARDGYPRITIFTGAAGREGMFSAPMTAVEFNIFCDEIINIANSAPGTRSRMTFRATVYENNQRTDKVRVAADIFIAKNEEGIVVIGATAENYPKLVFEFQISPFVTIYRQDGGDLSKADTSKMAAVSHARSLTRLMEMYLDHHQVDDLNTQTSGGARDSFAAAPATKVSSDFGDDFII